MDRKRKRVIKGNKTTIPKGAEVSGSFRMQAISQISELEEGNVPITALSDVMLAKKFVEENKK